MKKRPLPNRDSFSGLHPLLNFYFYIFVISAGMFFMHPIFLLIALSASFSYARYLNGARALRMTFFGLLPLLLVGIVINPLFNHAGVTILLYLEDGNPLTLESIVYGVAAALMFAVVILWFSCYNQTMTSDKFLYLFAKLSAKLSLLISLCLRFIPLYKVQLQKIRQSQRALGRDVNCGSLPVRIRHGMAIFSIMLTWALENAIITSDSMQARGYGLAGRSHFSLYRFDGRDRRLLGFMLTASVITLIGAFLGYNTVRYFPSIKYAPFEPHLLFFYTAYVAFCYLPLALDYFEERRWTRIRSKI